MNGTLKWYNRVKGYGFVAGAEGGPDLFFHHTDVRMDGKGLASLADKSGADVEYEEAASDRGPKATNVKLAAQA